MVIVKKKTSLGLSEMANRKYIRIALTDEDEAMLNSVKAKVEAETGLAMTDAQFVLSVLRQRLKA